MSSMKLTYYVRVVDLGSDTILAQTEIDLRLFGMLVALALILLTFNILSGGKFFQPTNMVTLAVQASGVAIIAIFYVLVNFAVDLLYTVLDPRIRHARAIA